jgi:hypothetical protein
MAACSEVSDLPATVVCEVVGTAGDSLPDFLAATGHVLRLYSGTTGFEACGMVARGASGTYAVVLSTNHSHLGCVIHHDLVPAGFVATGASIHSHGKKGSFRVNAADRAFRGETDDGRSHYIAGQDLNHFSPADYAGGPGYLATETGVIHQNGENTEFVVTSYAAASIGGAP